MFLLIRLFQFYHKIKCLRSTVPTKYSKNLCSDLQEGHHPPEWPLY